jgi:hypothetical protein
MMGNYPVPNADTVRTYRVDITALRTPVQLPDMEIPDDMSLLIKADPNNPLNSLVYVGPNAASVLDPSLSYPLARNEAIPYRISNACSLYVTCTMVPAWVIITAEQRRRRVN